jgi:ribosomal protein L19
MDHSGFKTGGIFIKLQQKVLLWLVLSPYGAPQFHHPRYSSALMHKYPHNYPGISWWLLKLFTKPGEFMGIGFHTYYSRDFSRKRRLVHRNIYWEKLTLKQDSRFFYGLVLAWHLNFLSSTVTIWNVFHNEILERNLPLFGPRTTLFQLLEPGTFTHFLASLIRTWKYWKRFFAVWKHPRALSWIMLYPTL